MKKSLSLWLLLALASGVVASAAPAALFPANRSEGVNPDTHLELTFSEAPVLGSSGQIRIYDQSNDRLVDMLDLSIPPGPKEYPASAPGYIQSPYPYVSSSFTNANTRPGTPSGGAAPTPDTYQLTIIGRFTDGFHFFPVIIHGTTATIYPHNNMLEYGKTYYVQIDPQVLTLSGQGFQGISGKSGWVFSTKKLPPSADSDTLVVSADGSGDFNTVQGAMDFIPDYQSRRVTVLVKNGTYEEIVYFRNKTNVTILGEDRDKVIVKYQNQESFNPHPANFSTNELPGTFPSRRAAFTVDHSDGIHLVNLTIMNTTPFAQAEGLLLNGRENIIYNCTVRGSGDALQSNGPAYYEKCLIEGSGDMILGRGPAFFKDCELRSPGPYMWIRNTSANHGNVFLYCRFNTTGNNAADLARSPVNGSRTYPYCEAVLIQCQLEGISPAGWGTIGGDASNVHFWEYNSTNIRDGKPVDVSRRHPASRQLSIKEDSTTIANYSNPAYVLGWTPDLSQIKR